MTAVETRRAGGKTWRALGVALLAMAVAVALAPLPASAQEAAMPSTGSVQPWMSLIQAVGYIALLLAAGLPWFRVFVVGAVDGATLRIATVAAVIATLAHIPMIALWTMRADGSSFSAIFGPEPWQVGLRDPKVRAISFIVVGLAIELWLARRGVLSRRGRWGVFLGGLVALGSMTIVGHTADIGNTWLMHGSDFLHGVVAATWFGGIVGLARYLGGIKRAPSGNVTPAEAASVVTRFSDVAGWALLLLAASGIVIAVRLTESFDALWQTDFGRLLLVKLGVVAVVVVLGGWNRTRLVPAIASERAPAAAWGHLRRTVLTEAVLLLVVLGITSFLVVATAPAA